MTDKEKALLWLKSFAKNKEPFTLIPKQLIRLIHDVLKEQEKPNGKCVNECECWDSAYERGKQDALKEQEADKPKGHWTTKRTLQHDGEWYCDQCEYEPTVFENTPFCPNCGAKMEGR